MKILIATGLYPPDIGGPATMVQALARTLKDQGFEVKIITYSTRSNGSEIEEGIEVNFISRNSFWRYLNYFLKMWQLSSWADVIYVTDTYSSGYFAYLFKKMKKKKYIVRFVGDSAWEVAVNRNWTTDYILDFQNRKYSSTIERLKERRKKILINADRVIVVSKFLADLANKIGVEKKRIKVIYNSIDFLQSEANAKKIKEIKQKYGKDRKIIITACRLTPWKGVDGIIKMLPLLKKEIKKVNLLVLGEGSELEKLKKLANDLGVAKEVFFLGKIPHEEILNYFKAADLFILNSNYEGLSHTLLEAMKAEVPIITTNIGGNSEVIDDGKEGLLVGYNKTEELVAASKRILTDSRLAGTFIKNAREKLKGFSWQNTVIETIKLMQKVTETN